MAEPKKKAAAKKKPAAKKPAAKKAAAPRKRRAAEPQVNRYKSSSAQPTMEITSVTVTANPEGLSYQPKHLELQNANLDQYSVEEIRQKELQAHRDEHNRRTGDGSRS